MKNVLSDFKQFKRFIDSGSKIFKVFELPIKRRNGFNNKGIFFCGLYNFLKDVLVLFLWILDSKELPCKFNKTAFFLFMNPASPFMFRL